MPQKNQPKPGYNNQQQRIIFRDVFKTKHCRNSYKNHKQKDHKYERSLFRQNVKVDGEAMLRSSQFLFSSY